MDKFFGIIAVGSWEDRFLLGMKQNIDRYMPEKVLIYYYREYDKFTKKNRQELKDICMARKIDFRETMIEFKDHIKTWKIIESSVVKEEWQQKKVLVDITTMPRDTIYSIFYFLENHSSEINYVYYKPDKYSEDWLSRDSGRPRLILKHSGIVKLGQKTALVVITGYDAERTEQLITFFEPELVYLGFQDGAQFQNEKLNLEKHKKYIEQWNAQTEVKSFSLDAYAKDNGYDRIDSVIKEMKSSTNIVMSSLGPKPSAVALYRICKTHPEVALSYAPSKEFNLNYSSGIGKETIGGL